MATKQDNQNKVSYLKQLEEIIKNKAIEKEQKEIKNLRVKIDSNIKAKSINKQENIVEKVEIKEKLEIKEAVKNVKPLYDYNIEVQLFCN